MCFEDDKYFFDVEGANVFISKTVETYCCYLPILLEKQLTAKLKILQLTARKFC